MQITRSQNNTPQLSLTIAASVEAIWDALRNKEKLLQWHGWDTPSLEEEIENIYFTDVKEDVAGGRRLLTVNGGDTFVVESEANVTSVTLVRAGLSGDPQWDAYYGNITEGWVSLFMEQLRFMLEKAPKSSRKATFANVVMERGELLRQLNLTDEKAGAHFSGRFQDDEISGSVWFSTPNQLGLVVDDWGPGLLVLQFSEDGSIMTRYDL